MAKITRYQLYTRQDLEQTEAAALAPYATPSQGSHGTRRIDESEHAYRTAFQRDRDRIIHSRAFRRLKHKRQVFLTSESDHYRTRITHTLEVAQLSRTMARALGLNEDLAEAIALGHDLGHTPFGHLGEVVLNEIMTGQRLFAGRSAAVNFGGFKHNYQSVRIVDDLERKYGFPGLNLTAQVREGILKHTRLRRGSFAYPDFHYDGLRFEQDMSATLEGQVVAISDEIAQRTHDLEDGIRAGLTNLKQAAEVTLIRQIVDELAIDVNEAADNQIHENLVMRELINRLVEDVITTTLGRVSSFMDGNGMTNQFSEELVSFSAELDPLQNELNKFIYQEIIHFSRVKWSDELGGKLLFRLFEAYVLDRTLLPEPILTNELGLQQTDPPASLSADEQSQAVFFRVVCDYVAGMTDAFAVREAKRLAKLGRLKIKDLKIEDALGS